MQPVDFTTLAALAADLRSHWLPARVEQVYQRDRYTIAIALRTIDQRGWLTVSWHPQAARVCIDEAPPRDPNTFAFNQQLRHQLSGLALSSIEAIAPWERVLDFQFTRRPGDPALWHLYIEVMGKYSNVVLATADQQIVTVAHQVSAQQSSVRPLLTGQPYEVPPALREAAPSLEESLERWRDRLALVPIPLKRALLQNYRGLSSALVLSMCQTAHVDANATTDTLLADDWERLFHHWRQWLTALGNETFEPAWTTDGYTVLGWNSTATVDSVQTVVGQYYRDRLNQQEFGQLKHQISQRLVNVLKKLYIKLNDFQSRLDQSDSADRLKDQADLLMAHLHLWEPGMTRITLEDFATGDPVAIALNPEKNAVQNAQALYKKHQKLRRSRQALEPLLQETQSEIDYLEQVQVALAQLGEYTSPDDLEALDEIREELEEQQYLTTSEQSSRSRTATNFRRYTTPGGLEIWVGRNNHQNDELTFRLATDYDLWFHSQEIPGSHVLLRLQPGHPAEEADLQFTADVAAFHSRAVQSEQVPVIYTEPRHVYKPKGAKPGMVIYKQERVIWGQPQRFAGDRQLASPLSS
ncbi:Rqc2 family fibronectin-binding protein [Leptolyngbya sp. AN02str]|uniref:Rqc2 family fibronectin-binding protein n=1 Tax=Leptolyngbya sp. AN02str TaxID=3423363 RepID=UPI003D311F7B